MDGEEKPKKTKKKKSATEGEGSGEKEHKPNWREVYATYEDIKDFLRGHVYLRYNTIKYQVEARLPSGDPFCCNGELAEFVKDEWQRPSCHAVLYRDDRCGDEKCGFRI